MNSKASDSAGTVIVTGADCGAGSGVVKLCLKAGYDVLFTYRSRSDRANELLPVSRRSVRKVKAIEADLQAAVTSYKVVGAAARLTPVVWLVNNDKSASATTAFLDTREGGMRFMLGASVMSGLRLGQSRVLPLLASMAYHRFSSA